MEAYCMKCRAKRQMRNERRVTLKNGRLALRGVCPACGGKMVRIVKG